MTDTLKNTPKNTPEEKNELIDAFKYYWWIVTHTNPFLRGLVLIEWPTRIKDLISEAEVQGQWNLNANGTVLDSHGTNELLLMFVSKGIPLLKVGDKEISCLADISKLWNELGIKSYKDDLYYYHDTCAAVMAYLEPQYQKIEKELMAGDLSQVKPASADSNVQNETVFFDDKKGYIWLDNDKKQKLEPEDAKVFKIVIEIFNSGQSHCRIEGIIESLCGEKIGFQQKITNNSAYKKCKSAFSTINAKYRKLLNTNDKKIMLIKSDGQKNIVLLKPVVFRELFRKVT